MVLFIGERVEEQNILTAGFSKWQAIAVYSC